MVAQCSLTERYTLIAYISASVTYFFVLLRIFLSTTSVVLNLLLFTTRNLELKTYCDTYLTNLDIFPNLRIDFLSSLMCKAY